MILALVNPTATLLHDPATDDTDRVANGLSGLLRDAELVPVTGLDETGLLAVPAAFTSWQVLLHGAVILRPDGQEDPAWRRLTLESQQQRAGALSLAAQAATHISQLGQLGLDVSVTERHGLPLLVRLSHPHGLELALEQGARQWQDWLEDGPFRSDLRLVRDGNVVTLLARELVPESAVNYVLSQLEDTPDLIVGLSAQASDAGFLALCDYALVPGPAAWPAAQGDAPHDPFDE